MKNAFSLRYTLLLLGAAALPGLAGCGWAPWSHSSVRPAGPAFADDALADYLPADTGAVYTVNQRQALNSPAGRKLTGAVRHFLDRETTDHPWLDSLGADPVNDVDWTQLIFCPPDLDQPLVLLRGRFDAARFPVGPGRLREASEGPFPFFELPGPQPGHAARLALVGGTLAVSDSRPRLLAALNYAVAPKPVTLDDAHLREMLPKVDRGQSVWLAVSFDKLGPIPRLTDLGLETVARPVLRHAESVHGGMTLGDDISGAFVFTAHSEADARELDEDLQASCTVAQGAYLLPGLDPTLLPLLEFMGTGTTTRDGRVVTLRCRLPADRVAP